MQTLKVKIAVEPEQSEALLETMHQFNAACNYVAEIAFQMQTADKIKLQPFVYHDIREKYGISSQMAIRAISKTLHLQETCYESQRHLFPDCFGRPPGHSREDNGPNQGPET